MRFCPNLKNKQVKKEFDELVDIFGEDGAYLLWNKNNGYSLDRAPNGEPSKLFEAASEGETRENAMIITAKEILSNKDDYYNSSASDIYIKLSDLVKTYGAKRINESNGTNYGTYRTVVNGKVQTVTKLQWEKAKLNGVMFDPTYKLDSQFKNKKNLAHEELKTYIRDKFGYNVQVVEDSEMDKKISMRVNACVYGDTIYIRASKQEDNSIMLEEALHAVMHTIAENNKEQFNALFEYAKQEYPKFWQQIQAAYADKSANIIKEELVTQVLSKYLRDELVIKGVNKRSFKECIKNFINKIVEAIKNGVIFAGVNEGWVRNLTGKDIANAFTFDELAKCFNIKDSKFVDRLPQNQIMYNSTAAVNSNKKLDDIQKKLIEQHTKLYNQYKKNLNKTSQQQKRQDQLWTTIQDLRSKENIESAALALNSAIQITGTYIVDSSTLQPIDAPASTILGYLQLQQKTDYANVTPEVIQDMYQSIISFYNDLYKSLFKESKNLDVQSQAYLRTLGTTLDYINQLWVEASNTVGDRIVDQLIDKYIHKSESEKDDMKIVAKDWLHKNEMYGDTRWLENMIRYSRQNSPIIKQAFQLIQDANQKTQKESQGVQSKITKMFFDASSLMNDLSIGNWQTELMERYTKGEKKGQFTGNFKSALNRGQFKYDLEQFMNSLIKKFDSTYGYHYETDNITGQVYRSDTQQSIEEESWDNGMPTYIKWRIEIENWLCDHSERRYTSQYYAEMLSKPYDYKKKTGHGLSPKTMSRQKYIQDQINYLLQKCTDKNTKIAHPENLNKDDRAKLKMWRDALNDLSNPFTVDGELKDGEDFQIAVELQAWNNFIQNNTKYDTLSDDYERDYAELEAQVQKGERPNSDLIDFVEENSQFDIDPEYLKMHTSGSGTSKDLIIAMYQQSIKRLINTKNGFRRDMHNIMFSRYEDPVLGGVLGVSDAIKCYRDADIKNEELQKTSGSTLDWDYFAIQNIPYTDQSGMYISKKDGQKYYPGAIPSDEAMSWFEFILEKYTDAAMDGRMPYYISNDESVSVDFSQFNGNRDAIKSFIYENILTYKHEYFDKKIGRMVLENRPLSIFSRLYPTKEEFGFPPRPTTRQVPKGRYTSRENANNSVKLYNPEFDSYKSEGTSMVPKWDIYGDQKFLDYVKSGSDKARYYKYLLDVMEQCWTELGLDPSYNRYKLPQMEGTGSQKFSRAYKHPGQYVKNKFQNAFGITSDDTEGRQDEDYVNQNGKWVLDSVATRYINELEDPNQISSDLAYTVGQFFRMTKNYINKKAIQPQLETLGYNLNGENRDEEYSTSGSRQYDIYRRMLKQLLYEDNMANQNEGQKPSKRLIAAQKAANSLRSLAALQKLGLNIPSILTGVWDSLTQIPSIAVRGDQFTTKSLMKSMIKTFPNIFKALCNIGNPIANCKAVAMMQKDQLVRDNKYTYSRSYKNRITKALSESIMGGYSMGDYMTNMLLQRSVYEAKRYYPGYTKTTPNGTIKVQEGFYIKNQLYKTLLDSGLSKEEAKEEIMSNLGNDTLWDAYEVVNGVAQLKDKYKNIEERLGRQLDSQESAIIKQTAVLVNGNNPDNDNSYVSNNIMYKFFFFLRNYITGRAEHWFAGWVPDNIVREKEEVSETQTRGATVLSNKKTKWKPLSDKDKARMGNYDYASGEVQPALLINLFRGARSQMRVAKNLLLGMIGKSKSDIMFNPAETRALKETVMYCMLLSTLTIGWMVFHGWAYEETKDLKPDNLEESLPTVNNFVKQKVYLKLIDNIMLRTIDSQFQLYNPVQVVDMVRNATSVMSAIDDWSAPTAAMLDLTGVSGRDLNDEITSDSRFKYFTRWQRSAITTFGPLNNLQKWASWRGNDKVERWFFDNTITGTGLKMSGVAWKNEKSTNPFQKLGQDIYMDTSLSPSEKSKMLRKYNNIQKKEETKRKNKQNLEEIRRKKKEAKKRRESGNKNNSTLGAFGF